MELLCIAEGPGGRVFYCRGEHLAGLLGGAEKKILILLLSVFQRALVSVLQGLLVSSSPSSPRRSLFHMHHLIRPALAALRTPRPPC